MKRALYRVAYWIDKTFLVPVLMRIAHRAHNRNPRLCWSDLVGFGMGLGCDPLNIADRLEFWESAKHPDECIDNAREIGCCYCGCYASPDMAHGLKNPIIVEPK